MKKKYITPKSLIVTVAAENILAGSLDVDNTPQNNKTGDAKERLFEYTDEEY